MRIINILIWGTLAFVLGMWYQAVLVRPKQNQVKQSLKVARSSAASCYWMIGDHWTNHHADYPMSRRIAATAFDLSEDFQRLMEEDK